MLHKWLKRAMKLIGLGDAPAHKDSWEGIFDDALPSVS